MLNRVLAAMALAFVLTTPAAAGQSPRAFHAEHGLRENPVSAQKVQSRQRFKRESVFGGKPVGRNAAQIAARHVGTKPSFIRRATLWCAEYVGAIERMAGRAGLKSHFARDYASYGRAVSSPQPGDIGVMARGKRGGHVAYFEGWAPNGKAIMISGNGRGGKVSRGQYAASRIYAWRRPA